MGEIVHDTMFIDISAALIMNLCSTNYEKSEKVNFLSSLIGLSVERTTVFSAPITKKTRNF